MSDTIEAVRSRIQSEFPGREVEYQYADSLHKFKLVGDKLIGGPRPHWLYLSEQLVEGLATSIVLNRMRIEGVLDRFRDDEQSWHLYMDTEQCHVVDEHFAKAR